MGSTGQAQTRAKPPKHQTRYTHAIIYTGSLSRLGHKVSQHTSEAAATATLRKRFKGCESTHKVAPLDDQGRWTA